MVAKHKEHHCKEGHLQLSTFMEVLKHIAKHHCKKQSDEEEINGQKEKQDEDELVPKYRLDEFLVKQN